MHTFLFLVSHTQIITVCHCDTIICELLSKETPCTCINVYCIYFVIIFLCTGDGSAIIFMAECPAVCLHHPGKTEARKYCFVWQMEFNTPLTGSQVHVYAVLVMSYLIAIDYFYLFLLWNYAFFAVSISMLGN